jgi:hypothetical protein
MKKYPVTIKVGGVWRTIFRAGRAWKMVYDLYREFLGSCRGPNLPEFGEWVAAHSRGETRLSAAVEAEIREVIYAGGDATMSRLAECSDASVGLRRFCANPANLGVFSLFIEEVELFEREKKGEKQ